VLDLSLFFLEKFVLQQCLSGIWEVKCGGFKTDKGGQGGAVFSTYFFNPIEFVFNFCMAASLPITRIHPLEQ